MTAPRSARPPALALLLVGGAATLLATFLATFLGGCSDSPVCVFGGSCAIHGGGGGTDGALGTVATLPLDGEWIVDGRPEVEDAFPSGAGHPPSTPIVVRFSESVSPDSLASVPEPEGGEEEDEDEDGDGGFDDPFGGLDGGLGPGIPGGGETLGGGAFELFHIDPGTQQTTGIQIASAALVGDGRLRILLPAMPLAAGDYELRFASGARVLDLTGEVLVASATAPLTTFSVSENPPAAPRVVATWPPDGAMGQSETTQLAVVFDRPMEAASVAPGWQVLVGGEEPEFDPAPVAAIRLGGLLDEVDTRAFTWRSVDPLLGMPVLLGTGADVDLTLSPASAPIRSAEGEELATTSVGFRTAPFGAPTRAEILSLPTDAIGLANLGLDPDVGEGEERELEIEVTLRAGRGGDTIGVFLFGDDLSGNGDLVALGRERAVPGSGAVASETVGLAQLDLVDAAQDPPSARFADGLVRIAVQVRRGSLVSPVRLLDVDPLEPGAQDPLLDTLPPELLELVVPGEDTALLHTDQRGLSVSGFSNDDLGAVTVRAQGAANGLFPTAPVGTTAVTTGTGENAEERLLFTAAPVPLGVVGEDSVEYEIVVFDRALNGSPAAQGVFEQRGAVGPDPLVVGPASLAVTAFDERTLAAVVDARVRVVLDQLPPGDPGLLPQHDSVRTDASGRAVVDTPAQPFLVEVTAAGYESFLFMNPVASRLGVPLRAVGSDPATVSTEVTAGSARAAEDLVGLAAHLGDTRRAAASRPTLASTCAGLPGLGTLTVCRFGPEDVRTGRLGAQSFLAGTFALPDTSFNAGVALQAFEWLLPLPAAVPGEATATELVVDRMLTEVGQPDAVELSTVFLAESADGIDFDNLVDTPFGDPGSAQEPVVAVEALVPGLGGVLPIGPAMAYDQGGGRWKVRSVQPGSAAALVASGVLEDVRVRLEFRDGAGNRSGERPRVDVGSGQVGNVAPVPMDVAPPDVPTVQATTPAVADGSLVALRLDLSNVLPGERGLYGVTLEHGTGTRRAWVLDPADGAVPTVTFPLAATGGAVDGGILELTIDAVRWDAFDPRGFLWSDLEREAESYATAVGVALEVAGLLGG